jgi:hypothetical protein
MYSGAAYPTVPFTCIKSTLFSLDQIIIISICRFGKAGLM